MSCEDAPCCGCCGRNGDHADGPSYEDYITVMSSPDYDPYYEEG